MKLFKKIFLLIFFIHFITPSPCGAVKIRDLAYIEGLRGNKLIGYGLVVGLNGTGDKQGTEFTIQSLTNMLRTNGILVSPNDVKVKNVAAVMTTAELPPFPRKGIKIDVLVSSIGDATSLQGGTLLLTPIKGADGEIYAVAQGPISIGGFSADGGGGEKIQKNHLNAGKIPEGAIIEREIPYNFSESSTITFSLRNSNFSTTNKVAQKINEFLGNSNAYPKDAANVTVDIPDEFRSNPVKFVSLIENLDVIPEIAAKVVIDERTGTVVVGEDVTISTLAISHGNLTIEINSKYKISQPSPLSKNGKTVVVPETQTSIKEEKGNLILLERGISIKDLVRGLNAIGVTTRDLITIFQAIKSAGALHAALEII